MDFRKTWIKPSTISFLGDKVNVVESYSYIGAYPGKRQDGKCNTEGVYRMLSSQLETTMETLELVLEQRMLHKLLTTVDDV